LTIARGLLALLCGLQGVGPLIVDLNHTHATNPEWPRHARFHLVWQATSYALLSVLEIALVLAPGPYREQRFYLTAILASLPMLGFFAAVIGRAIYGGALSDWNGILPARIIVSGCERQIDLSLVVEVAVLLMLLAICALYRY
jgi:hypothetical protein